ncbi:kinase-like domain-containing protein [Hypoxylon sp. FL0543]|nr:kinase-like domain-containing protein [Hypoxylon sp. FL0543]
MIQHLKCRRIRERDLVFDSHMSGFVYKVRVAGQTLIKKEIPGPDTVDEFLYEVNALNSLRFSRNVIEFYGVVVDDDEESVKGLLINYAEKGALIDVIYDSQEEGRDLPWPLREKWARQIVQGLSDVHEAGFVQGDLTLSNIVIDYENNAKIIDINRRGCPVGWEPPEATPLIDSNQRISMYIGVKSDLYQLGMVLWALATLEDEPEAHRRPLHLDPEIEVPGWYRTMVEYCLHENPRVRLQATVLLTMFPHHAYDDEYDRHTVPSISVEDGFSLREYTVDGRNGHPQLKAVQPREPWSYAPFGNTYVMSPAPPDEPSRGRSPPRSLPSSDDMYDPAYNERWETWPDNAADPTPDEIELGEEERADTPRESQMAAETMANLSQLEAGQAQAIDSENQTKATTSAVGNDKAPKVVVDDVEKAIPLTDKGTEAVTPDGGPIATATLGQGQILENSQPEEGEEALKQKEMVQLDELRGVGTAVGLTSVETEEAVQPPTNGDGVIESLNHYTNDRSRDIPARSTEASPSGVAESPPKNVPSELSGIGAKYEQVEYPTPAFSDDVFSDEELGISTTPTTNVASQA